MRDVSAFKVVVIHGLHGENNEVPIGCNVATIYGPNIISGEPCNLVFVFGIARSGKSFLMNRLLASSALKNPGKFSFLLLQVRVYICMHLQLNVETRRNT